MSIIKILASLAAPHHNGLKKARKKDDKRDEEERARQHAKTFGISSDPTSAFALAFAALIHDVGKSNLHVGYICTSSLRLTLNVRFRPCQIILA